MAWRKRTRIARYKNTQLISLTFHEKLILQESCGGTLARYECMCNNIGLAARQSVILPVTTIVIYYAVVY